jgi:hypothetical protein
LYLIVLHFAHKFESHVPLDKLEALPKQRENNQPHPTDSSTGTTGSTLSMACGWASGTFDSHKEILQRIKIEMRVKKVK